MSTAGTSTLGSAQLDQGPVVPAQVMRYVEIQFASGSPFATTRMRHACSADLGPHTCPSAAPGLRSYRSADVSERCTASSGVGIKSVEKSVTKSTVVSGKIWKVFSGADFVDSDAVRGGAKLE